MICNVLTLRQIKTKIREANIEKERGEVVAQCHKNETLRHYTRVASETNFIYGKYRAPWKDSVCTKAQNGLQILLAVECGNQWHRQTV